MRRGKSAPVLTILAAIVAAVVYQGSDLSSWLDGSASDAANTPTANAPANTPANTGGRDSGLNSSNGAFSDALRQLIRQQRSGQMVTTQAKVDRLLPDDNYGSRHQRFLIRDTNDDSVLIAHNIDIAERLPLSEGDSIRLRGQFEWNEKGGVLHWTHHAPRGDHPGGWIDFAGKRYE